MCRLFLIRASNPKYTSEIAYTLALRAINLKNTDGYGVFFNNETFRTMLQAEYLKKLQEIRSDFLIAHLRIATVGSKTVDNVHLWRDGDWVFAHNGSVGAYSVSTYYSSYSYEYSKWIKKKKSDETDSFLFFKDLLKDPDNLKYIQEIMSKKRFSGVGILYNVKNKFYIVLADRNFYLAELKYKDGKAYVISSKEDIVRSTIPVDTKIVTSTRKVGPFEYLVEEIEYVDPEYTLHNIDEGVFKIKIGDNIDEDKTIAYL